jgi:ABC-type enterobactin transport system permease subunit
MTDLRIILAGIGIFGMLVAAIYLFVPSCSQDSAGHCHYYSSP